MSPMYRSFYSPPTAAPCITFLVSVCIAELRDSVHSICDAVFKEWANGLTKSVKNSVSDFSEKIS